jgi:anti-sigma regulatory factor (Ser/Thr protein kinase)
MNEIKDVRDNVRKECENLQLDPKDSFVLFFIADELCCNVMEHSQAKKMELKVEARGNDFLMELKDDGVAFDTGFKLEMAKTGEVRTDGDRRLGLALVSRLVDQIEYERSTQGFNQLKLIKKI